MQMKTTGYEIPRGGRHHPESHVNVSKQIYKETLKVDIGNSERWKATSLLIVLQHKTKYSYLSFTFLGF